MLGRARRARQRAPRMRSTSRRGLNLTCYVLDLSSLDYGLNESRYATQRKPNINYHCRLRTHVRQTIMYVCTLPPSDFFGNPCHVILHLRRRAR